MSSNTTPANLKSSDPNYHKRWYQANKEKHLAYLSQKIICECGKQVSRNSIHRHRLTTTHSKRMKDQGYAWVKINSNLDNSSLDSND